MQNLHKIWRKCAVVKFYLLFLQKNKSCGKILALAHNVRYGALNVRAKCTPMGQDNQDGLKKMLDFSRAIGILFYLLNIYWFCRLFFLEMLPAGVCERTYQFLDLTNQRLHLFSSVYVTLFISLLFIAFYGFAERGKKEEKIQLNPFISPICSLLERIGVVDRGEDGRVMEENDNGKTVLKIKPIRTEGWCIIAFGLFFVVISPAMLRIPQPLIKTIAYIFVSGIGILYFIFGGNYIHKVSRSFEDTNSENEESFKQNEELIDNPYSVNLRTQYRFKGKEREGWINVVNPFRATSVLGTPGSGKTYAVINEFIRQHLKKNFTMYCYDFKFPDLSTIVYNHMKWNEDRFMARYGLKPKFCVINFDDPRRSLRCNPIHPKFMSDITDAYDSAYTIMLNLNKSWAQKQGDFFVESPINYLTASIWYLKEIEGGKYCTLPHVIEWINSKYVDCIPLMSMNPSLVNYMSAFMEAWEGGAQDQLQGQIASVRISLSRISSPQLYWVMTGNDFTLDLNNPEEPKVLCVGNNPEKKDIYATALGLYNGRIVKVINKKEKHPISLIIDELPTIYFRGLDNLIATARANKVSVCLGYQDFTQLIRDYGEKEAKAIINTIGNLFCGQVTGDTATQLEKRFGKNMQRRKSQSYNSSGVSTSISEQNDTMIPASKISTLTQGTFVGAVADNFGEEISEKIFNAKIVIDNEAVKAEEAAYQPLPIFYNFDSPAEVNELKQFMLNFLKGYYVIACDNAETLREIMGIESSSVQTFLNSFNGFAEFISQIGKTISGLCAKAIEEIASLNACRGDSDTYHERMRQIVIGFITDRNVTNWISKEKEFKENKYAAEGLRVGEVLREIMERIDSLEESGEKQTAPITEKLELIQRYFTNLKNFSSHVQEIRDQKMNDVLKQQEEQVRADIRGLIDRQLKILESDERWQQLSKRRREAMGIEG